MTTVIMNMVESSRLRRGCMAGAQASPRRAHPRVEYGRGAALEEAEGGPARVHGVGAREHAWARTLKAVWHHACMENRAWNIQDGGRMALASAAERAGLDGHGRGLAWGAPDQYPLMHPARKEIAGG